MWTQGRHILNADCSSSATEMRQIRFRSDEVKAQQEVLLVCVVVGRQGQVWLSRTVGSMGNRSVPPKCYYWFVYSSAFFPRLRN